MRYSHCAPNNCQSIINSVVSEGPSSSSLEDVTDVQEEIDGSMAIQSVVEEDVYFNEYEFYIEKTDSACIQEYIKQKKKF